MMREFMSVSDEVSTTQLLQTWGRGDREALNCLLPRVYGELHKLAHHYMAQEQQENLLQTTALIKRSLSPSDQHTGGLSRG
jgi:hypothetical protein